MTITAPIFGIKRLTRSNGQGYTSLVGFGGCPLRCQYCINPQCHYSSAFFELTTKELYHKVKIDNIYFQATGGGICFGGGEPGLRSGFIADFKNICPSNWKMYIETSLNYNSGHVTELIPVIDHWFIDIKETNPDIYKRYTGQNPDKVFVNLNLLKESRVKGNITVRIPLIEGYNSQSDTIKSQRLMNQLGLKSQIFSYKITGL